MIVERSEYYTFHQESLITPCIWSVYQLINFHANKVYSNIYNFFLPTKKIAFCILPLVSKSQHYISTCLQHFSFDVQLHWEKQRHKIYPLNYVLAPNLSQQHLEWLWKLINLSLKMLWSKIEELFTPGPNIPQHWLQRPHHYVLV